MDKEAAMKKIRKCLALAKSSEPHESAAAMRQAQKLMELFGVDSPELLAAGASEEWKRSAATSKPPSYEVRLADVIAEAFGCRLIFKQRRSDRGFALHGGYAFVGVEPSPTVASYSYAVLRRQLAHARAEYVKTALRRLRKNKIAAADLFCDGWVRAVERLVTANPPSAEQASVMDAYMALHYSETSKLKSTQRELTPQAQQNAGNHSHHGWLKGREAQLNKGVGANAHEQIGN